MGRFDAIVRPFFCEPGTPRQDLQDVRLDGLEGLEPTVPTDGEPPEGPAAGSPGIPAAFAPTELKVAWLRDTLWVVPDEVAGATLVANGISRGRIWTAEELADIFRTPGITQDHARIIRQAKLEFDGEIMK